MYVLSEAPDTTQALLLTEGSISKVQPASLSDLSNITVIGQSVPVCVHIYGHAWLLHVLLFKKRVFSDTPSMGVNSTHSGFKMLQVWTMSMCVCLSGLSHNHISVLAEQSFRALTSLHTLLLDHNLLTSQALQGGALINLTQLEVLALGHNLISMVGITSGEKSDCVYMYSDQSIHMRRLSDYNALHQNIAFMK